MRTIVWRIRIITEATSRLGDIPKHLKPIVGYFDDLAKRMPRIRYQWLSIMFLGWQLQRTFGGMVRPVAELMGVFEPFGLLLEDVLIPVLEPFADLMWDIYDAFDMLPDEVKELVGVFILAMAVFGGFVTFLGSFAVQVPAVAGAIQPLGLAFLAIVLIILIVTGKLKGFARWIMGPFWGMLGLLREHWQEIWNGIRTVTTVVINAVKQAIFYLTHPFEFLKNIVRTFRKVWVAAFNAAKSAVDWLVNAIKSLLDAFSDIGRKIESIPILGDIIRGLKGAWGAVTGLVGGLMGFQYGGFVPRTGLYVLHAGEYVTPAGGGIVFSPSITIHATLTQPMDIRAVADELERYWADKLGVRLWT